MLSSVSIHGIAREAVSDAKTARSGITYQLRCIVEGGIHAHASAYFSHAVVSTVLALVPRDTAVKALRFWS